MVQMFVLWRNHSFYKPSVPGNLASQISAGSQLGLSVLSWPSFSTSCQFSHPWNPSHLWNPVSEFVNHLGSLIIPFLCSTVFLILRAKSVLFVWKGKINSKRIKDEAFLLPSGGRTRARVENLQEIHLWLNLNNFLMIRKIYKNTTLPSELVSSLSLSLQISR